jgi:hypothetical protein
MNRNPDMSSRAAGSSPASAAPAPAIEAAVVLRTAQGASYSMYALASLSGDVAVLAGGLLLEKGEEVSLELRLPDRTVVRARARVTEILPGEHAAMRVALSGIDEADRQRLGRHAPPP